MRLPSRSLWFGIILNGDMLNLWNHLSENQLPREWECSHKIFVVSRTIHSITVWTRRYYSVDAVDAVDAVVSSD